MTDSESFDENASTDLDEDNATNDDAAKWARSANLDTVPADNGSKDFGTTSDDYNDPLLHLLVTGVYSDCEIKSHGHTWKAHQDIICPRNKYFERTFNGAFQEARIKVVRWDDEEPWAAEGLLTLLYTGRCPCSKIRVSKPQSEIEIHLKLVQIADRRLAAGLRKRTFDHFWVSLHRCKGKEDLSAVIQYVRASGICIDKDIGHAIAAALISADTESPDLLEVLWERGSLEYYIVRCLIRDFVAVGDRAVLGRTDSSYRADVASLIDGLRISWNYMCRQEKRETH
ncbi:MAG: hypothetical protein Q9160_001470 [Pyrenula sp. 1 TL-2023]